MKYRDARVHWFKCGWLPRQYRTLISQTAILPVSLTSRGRCCCEENTIWWSNSYKRTNYLSEIFLSSQIETFYARCSYQNVSHINGCLFLTRNSPVVEVGSLPQLRTYTFLNSFDLLWFFLNYAYIILIAKLNITNFDTSSFLRVGMSPSSVSSIPSR